MNTTIVTDEIRAPLAATRPRAVAEETSHPCPFEAQRVDQARRAAFMQTQMEANAAIARDMLGSRRKSDEH